MKLHILQDLKNCGKLPPITFNANTMIGKKPDKNYYFLKVNINTHPVEANRTIVLIYVPIFSNSLDEALLKFLVLLNKILKGQNITTGPQCYMIMNNLLSGDSLQVF